MSRTHLGSGRTNQKLRTRQDLLDAARQLVEAGETPTVSRVAEMARVSRATAYRYFPNPQAMLLEAPLDAGIRSPEEVLPEAGGEVEDRVAAVVKYVYGYAAENEASFRAYLGALMDQGTSSTGEADAAQRGGRRERMLKRALEGRARELTKAQQRKLVTALSFLTGIEAVVVTRDVLGLQPRQGRAAAEWAARVLVREALDPRSD